MYYDYSERVNTLAPHRVMAIDRGEKEKVLNVSISFNEEYIEIGYVEDLFALLTVVQVSMFVLPF